MADAGFRWPGDPGPQRICSGPTTWPSVEPMARKSGMRSPTLPGSVAGVGMSGNRRDGHASRCGGRSGVRRPAARNLEGGDSRTRVRGFTGEMPTAESIERFEKAIKREYNGTSQPRSGANASVRNTLGRRYRSRRPWKPTGGGGRKKRTRR
jgi:hypothetical protein